MIESVHLSRMRTGAASGIATRVLAREDASRLAVLGAGSQALAQIEAVCAVRPIRTVRVWSRDAARLRAFCARASTAVCVPVLPVDSAREAVRGADIVTLITSAREPVVEGRWLEPGQHVNAAGSNALDRRELDSDGARALRPHRRRRARRRAAGMRRPAAARGARPVDWARLTELGEILVGQAPGRASDAEITLFESHGMGVQDLYAAYLVEQAACAGDASASSTVAGDEQGVARSRGASSRRPVAFPCPMMDIRGDEVRILSATGVLGLGLRGDVAREGARDGSGGDGKKAELGVGHWRAASRWTWRASGVEQQLRPRRRVLRVEHA